ncbi:DUF935 domain-containing protein [Nitratireductor mangrovi]|uniref:DUF935 domain-containing protein n=1 Tax=Nitratireductor mangrovi TaxID=2599600 RepID=A0A5B8KU11_9HYPH|nr:DUF935 domain-containing protein [Nitratireductor mangrovi]QDY99073.1 DUF935 domain-containing protein [Nitratireductor mangrovi]
MADFTWYDAYGRPVDTGALKEEQAAPTIKGIRRPDALHPAAGLTPGRLAAILRDSIEGSPEAYLALAEDIEERDNHYLSVLSTRKFQVAGLEITVEAAGDDAKSVAVADLVREVISRDSFEVELRDILDATGKGFSCTEIIWDTSESQWMPKRLAWRDPRWFVFDPIDGETPLVRQLGEDEPLKPFGWIYHSFKAKSGLPIRGGLARGAAWSFLFKSFTVKDWAIFCEAYGQPLRLGKWGPGATEKDKEVLAEAVASIGTDYSAIVPASMAVEFISAEISGSHELYEKRADWLDRQISKLVLGQTSTTDAQKGSYAVGTVHDRVRDDIEKADAKALAATLNRDLVKPLVDLNHGPQKSYPHIRIGRPEEIDAPKFMATVEKFVRLGGKVGAATVRDKLGLPDPAADEELLTAAKAAPQPGEETEEEPDQAADDRKPPKGQGAMAAQRGRVEPDAIDRLAKEAAGDWQELVGPMIAGLEEEIARATDLDQVRAILSRRFDGMDVSAMQEELARAVFAARLAGEADEQL